MDIPFITSISLVWLIYTYLFIEADRQILDLFNRLKFSLAVNNAGMIEKEQLEVKMYLGIPEVISLGQVFSKNDSHRNNIEQFEKKIKNIDVLRKLLMINLFLLTFHPLLCFFNYFLTLQAHLVLSLIFSLCFYWYVQKLPQLIFSKMVSTDKKNN